MPRRNNRGRRWVSRPVEPYEPPLSEAQQLQAYARDLVLRGLASPIILGPLKHGLHRPDSIPEADERDSA